MYIRQCFIFSTEESRKCERQVPTLAPSKPAWCYNSNLFVYAVYLPNSFLVISARDRLFVFVTFPGHTTTNCCSFGCVYVCWQPQHVANVCMQKGHAQLLAFITTQYVRIGYMMATSTRLPVSCERNSRPRTAKSLRSFVLLNV